MGAGKASFALNRGPPKCIRRHNINMAASASFYVRSGLHIVGSEATGRDGYQPRWCSLCHLDPNRAGAFLGSFSSAQAARVHTMRYHRSEYAMAHLRANRRLPFGE